MNLDMPNQRPNVIVFFTDQQRWDTTGVHGNPLNLTPNFDRMAVQGTHVCNSFTCQPVCAPARASLQTGLYATNTGVWRNGIGLPQASQTLARCFAAAGYATGYIGKWHLYERQSDGIESKAGNLGAVGPVPKEWRGGYDYWLGSNALEFTSDAYDVTMYDNDNRPVRLPGYRVDALTDVAIRYIDDHQADHFFLFVSYIEPHFQNRSDDYPAPDGYEERYRGRWMPPDLAALGGSAHQHLAGYYGMCKRLDEALGRMLDALKSLKLDDNTIVLFTSDHGNHFKTRNGEYKRSCHDSSIRVPTAFTGPGFVGGGRLPQLVSLVDLPPTLLDAAGLPVPTQMQGRSLLPLIRHEGVEWPHEVFVQISESQVGRAIRTPRWKYSVAAKGKTGWDTPASEHYTEDCLYDLRADPYELVNLAGFSSHRELAAALRQRLVQRMVEAGEAAPAIELAPEKPHSRQRAVLPDEIDA
jgi:arylsulfatase A-like enzyme